MLGLHHKSTFKPSRVAREGEIDERQEVTGSLITRFWKEDWGLTLDQKISIG